MNTVACKDWKELSEAAAREQDPEKLMELVEELNRLLEERENEVKRQRSNGQYDLHPGSATFGRTVISA